MTALEVVPSRSRARDTFTTTKQRSLFGTQLGGQVVSGNFVSKCLESCSSEFNNSTCVIEGLNVSMVLRNIAL